MRSLFLVLFSLVSLFASAQDGIIRGTVIDGENGEPVIGATILIKELSTGTATDIDGQFSLDLAPGTYSLQVSYVSYQTLTIESIAVTAGEVNVLGEIKISEGALELEEVVVTAQAVRSSEVALLLVKRKSAVMMDGISSAKIQLVGDATAVEAAKRVTGVSVEGGKYVYVRGLGDRYSKTLLNGVDIPGLDPDRNTLQMDIFPTNLIDNIVVSKNFTAEMPADFTGGVLNIETKDFPEEKVLSFSFGAGFNPNMHLNPNYLTYEGGKTDFLGFDDGARALPELADQEAIPTPVSGASDKEVTDFVSSFNPELGAVRQTSPVDFSAGFSYGNQFNLKKEGGNSDPKLGVIFSLSYKNDFKYYDQVTFAEYQRLINPDSFEMRYATIQTGELGERNVLIGALGGLAYKTMNSKVKFTAMRLQNGESRAGKFFIDNDGERVGQSGYIAASDNLEYNQRSLTNLLLNGSHVINKSRWLIDWSLSPTISTLEDPDIRKTAFTFSPVDTFFSAGAAGNPSRIWRSLNEISGIGKLDFIRNYSIRGLDAKLRFGASHTYKKRDYEILFFDIQFFGNQDWPTPDPSVVLNPENLFPNQPNSIYYQSGNNTPNPNEYSSNINNTGLYVSNEFFPLDKLKAILGVRAENYVQRHTGRDQIYANGDIINGQNLDNEVVLESLDFFPTANFIYSVTNNQNIRASYSRTIARPSFKELSFAQIIDPITNRIFNGSLFTYTDWEGQLTETRINNVDLRWELFLENGQIFSVSGFYKDFENPIELVRIPQQQTSTEFQPRNVGDGRLYGLEFEFRKDLTFLGPNWNRLNASANVTLVRSEIDMTDREFQSRKTYEKTGETITNTRQMAGQAPYVINAGLTYSHQEIGLDAGLFYNVKGPTLSIVGAGLFPDVYIQPFNSLNFSLNKKIGKEKNTTLDFKVSNILNDRMESFYTSFNAEDQIFDQFIPRRAFSLGLSHRF